MSSATNDAVFFMVTLDLHFHYHPNVGPVSPVNIKSPGPSTRRPKAKRNTS
jgi:hypothetical protein